MRINQSAKNTLLSLKSYPTDIDSLSELFQSIYKTNHLPRLNGIINLQKHSSYSNYYDLFFQHLLPWMIVRVQQFLKSGRFDTIDRFKQQVEREIEIPKDDVLDLIISMFFGLYSNPKSNNNIDFYVWLTSSNPIYGEKLLCLFEYFKQNSLSKDHKGTLIIQRKVLNPQFTKESFYNKTLDLKDSIPTTIYSKMILDDKGLIGDIKGEAEVDFADEYIGGLVLYAECAQEEVMFLVNPELIVTMLFCEVMSSNEAILIHNVVTYIQSKGYSRTFKFDGPSSKAVDRPEGHTVIAIDALNHVYDFYSQFTDASVLREINKIYIGFSSIPVQTPIASGKWGCGVFYGFSPLKILLQWIVTCMNNQELHIYTFGDPHLKEALSDFQSFLLTHNVSLDRLVSSLFENIPLLKDNGDNIERFFNILKNSLQ